jgi:site-specific DNA recombinase
MPKVAIYARVSTLDKQDYKRQLNDCTTTILSQGYTQDDIEPFAEKISGYKKNEDRPVLESMLNIIRNNPKHFDCIYITEVSRLGRDPNYTRKLIDELSILKVPIYIQSIGQKTLDANGERNSTMNIVIQVLMEFSHSEARTLSTRSKSGLLDSAKDGNVGGGAYKPYGYKKDEKGKLAIDTDESKIITKIYELYQAGNGCKKIAGYLNENNIPTRANKLFNNRKMKVGDKTSDEIIWSDKTINDIINNPLYKGDRRFKDKLLPAPAIISTELWNECNELMKTKTHRNYLTTYTYLLKDLLVCGCCGRNYFAKYKPVPSGDKVYICSSRLIKGGNCGNAGINISLLESAIYDQLLNTPRILNYMGNPDIKKELQSNVISLQQQLITTTKEVSTIENKQKRLFDLYENSTTMSVEDYDIRASKLINESKLINDKISIIKKELSQNKSALSKQDDKKATYQMLLDAKDNRSELATIYKQFINRIVINNIDGKIALASMFIGAKGTIIAKNPLKIILDLNGVKKRPMIMKYTALQSMECDPYYNNKNILLTPIDDIKAEIISNEDVNGWNTINKENYTYINKSDIN